MRKIRNSVQKKRDSRSKTFAKDEHHVLRVTSRMHQEEEFWVRKCYVTENHPRFGIQVLSLPGL